MVLWSAVGVCSGVFCTLYPFDEGGRRTRNAENHNAVGDSWRTGGAVFHGALPSLRNVFGVYDADTAHSAP